MPHSEFAGIYGGNTKPEQRNRGIYTALVAARLREALVRNRRYLIVDALPTSEPILRNEGSSSSPTPNRPVSSDTQGLGNTLFY